MLKKTIAVISSTPRIEKNIVAFVPKKLESRPASVPRAAGGRGTLSLDFTARRADCQPPPPQLKTLESTEHIFLVKSAVKSASDLAPPGAIELRPFVPKRSAGIMICLFAG